MTISTAARAIALTTCFIAAFQGCAPDREPEWHAEHGYRWREAVVHAGAAGFTSMSASDTHVQFSNDIADSVLLGNRILGQGAGVALGDVDGDGKVDVFLARSEGCSALYRNLGAWKFDDITKHAGVGACGRHATGAAFADVDGDGDLDLILLSTTGPNSIFINDGHGAFTEHRDLGLDTTGRGGTTITMADVNGDGRLSMYVANYKPYNVDDTIPPQQRAFNQMVRKKADGTYEIVAEHRRDYKLVMRPDMGGLRMTQRAQPDDFYDNDGKGHFTRVPFTSDRFVDAQGHRISEDAESFALGAKFVDLNGDGAPDLYVGNDFEDPDALWFNDGHGKFRLAGWNALRQMSNSTMGFDVADVNGDGLPDIFTDDMLANDGRRLKTQIPTHTSLPKHPGDEPLQLQMQRNSLFLNQGDGTFAEVSHFAGVTASGWSWGSMFMDVDLDGWQDILVANGHLWDIMDADVLEGLQNRLSEVPWRRLRWQFPALKIRNVAYRNRGNLTFDDASAAWKFGIEDDISHSLAAADLDGDGDLDVVVNRLRAPALLMRNDAGAARVAVRLVGDAPNTKAVGAKIYLRGGAVPVQMREVTVGGLYMSHSDYEASFAMGASKSATIEVVWRDGRHTSIADVRPNRIYEITTATATAGTASTPSTTLITKPAIANDTLRRDAPKSDATPTTLFEDATPELGGHTHTEDVFDDWNRQFLLPNALSQLGPGVSWFDVDRDGREDLIVGTGKGGRIAIFHNQNGKLVAEKAQGPTAVADFSSVLGITQNGKTRLLAGVSTWQARSDSELTSQPAVISVGVNGGALSAKVDAAVGSHPSSTGPVALGDFDGDGQLDLFVGSRAIAMQYPLPASSGLFRNVNGQFVYDTTNAAILRNVGLVSAAMFADMNGDGHADLVIAREWGSVLLLLNDGHGKFSDASAAWHLAGLTSRWNGIAAGDIDGDGKLDLVATSWGRNTQYEADSARPLVMLYGPVGAKNEQEMILARQDSRVKGLLPYTSYGRARVALPAIVSRVNSFAAYADANAETILAPVMSRMTRVEANTLNSTVFLNRGDHFDAKPLPDAAQFAPAFYAGIADFDGDGAEDVFLSQNFFPTAIGLPRYDGGRSLLLKGDGSGTLTAMNASTSGLVVYGDQRGAAYADFDGDGRLDIAVSQNGSATRLFHNRGAKPGLRVHVVGDAANPDAVGAQIRVVYGNKMGPVREIQAGSGYWSQNGAIQVFGLSAEPIAVWVRWPGGLETRTPVTAGTREVSVTR